MRNKRKVARQEQEEKLLRKWNLKNNEAFRSPRVVVRELIEEEKIKLRKKVTKRLAMEMSKEGYSSFVLNVLENFKVVSKEIINTNETINRYISSIDPLKNEK